MKAVGWIALLLVVAVSVVGWAQCGCEPPEGPTCYRTFRTNETIEIKLIAPVDYFIVRGDSVSPKIFGWWVEAWDGTIVRTATFKNGPVARWNLMEWDMRDSDGDIVPSGFYRIVVETTDGLVLYPVKILERCRPCTDCFCWSLAPINCYGPCSIPFGSLYLSLEVGETRACTGLLIRGHVEFEIDLSCVDPCEPNPCCP